MASCNEKKGVNRCSLTIKKCSNCGNVGCERYDCKNSAFDHGTCRKCGKSKKENV